MLVLAGVGTAHAQRNLTNIPDPDPELERQALQVADGFEVNLWAADPLLAKPIQINFDPRGRLWVAASEVYPQIAPGQEANDKIVVLEDTKGVGHADKVTVFADGLLIPTAVIPGDGGAYVANSTELLHFGDSKGTLHADSRRVMLSGFGTEDTHHILHTLRWGPDGLLYFNQSVYIHSHIETPWGPRHLNAGGVWQFSPDSMKLEVFCRGWVNSWGHEFDRWGQSFMTDGAGGDGISYGFPGGCYTWAADARRVIEGMNPGSPKYCSIEILSGRQMPDDWQGNIVTNDFRAHRVCRFVLSEDGAGYSSKELPELIKTNHPAFRPIDCKMGPDGALYIADWYNPIIQHGEVDFRDPRRDHTHGRIWRVTAKNRAAVPRPKLVEASDDALLDFLKLPEDWTRAQARRVIKERGERMIPVLAAWLTKLDPHDPEVEHQKLEALWCYEALRHIEPDLLHALLHSPEPHARAAAVRVLAAWHEQLPDTLSQLSERIVDDFPRVRLEAVRALALIPTAEAAQIAMRALDRPLDKFLDFALWQTARDLQPAWLPAVQSGTLNFDDNVQHLIFALQAVDSADVVSPLMTLLREGKLPADRTESVLLMVAALGGPNDLAALFDLATADATPPARRAALLSGLAKAAAQRRVIPAGDLSRLSKLLDGDEAALAARLVGLWKIESLRPRLVEIAQAARTPDSVRQSALDGLASLGGPSSHKLLTALTASQQPFATQALAAAALAGLDMKAGAARAVAVLETAPDGADPTALFNAFLDQKKGPAALAAALAGKKLAADVAKLGIRAIRATASEQPELTAALTTAGRLGDTGPRMPKGAELQQLVDDVKTHGDPARGEALFHRRDMLCLKCHAIGGVGGAVGPDLVSIGGSAQIDYIIESILDPSAKIKEGYHSVRAVTDAGRVFTGIKLRQTDKDLILRDADDHELAIPVSTIESQDISRTSLMPVGLADGLTRAELVDLTRFLSELGKVGPYSLSKTPTPRRWQALVPTAATKSLLATDAGFAKLAADDPSLVWEPAYARVSGDLPIDDLPQFAGPDGSPLSVVRCRLDVSSPGIVRLQLNSDYWLGLWIDRQVLPPLDLIDKPLTVGSHTLTYTVHRKERRDPIHLELGDPGNSPARAQFAVGK